MSWTKNKYFFLPALFGIAAGIPVQASHLRSANDVFTSEKMDELFTRYHDLISPYVIGPEETESGKYTQLSSSASFTSELSNLKQHVSDRQAAVESFLP